MITNPSCGEITKSLDTEFVDAIFNVKDTFQYSPIVFFTKSQQSKNILLEKLFDKGVLICDGFTNPNHDEAIVLLLYEQIQEDLIVQEQLVLLLDSVKETRKTIFLITHTSINNMKLIGKLRARLLSGVHAEI